MAITQFSNEKLPLQTQVALELDRSFFHIYALSEQYSMCRTHPVFINSVADLFITANNKVPPEHRTLKDNKEKLIEILNFAAEEHAHQDRDSGYPYVAHAFSTGYPLARFGLPKEVIFAGVNHDVYEETLKKEMAMQRLYDLSPDASLLVFAVSAQPIERMGFEYKDHHLHNQIESFSEYANNPYAKIIKYFDNISNLFDLWGMKDKHELNSLKRKEKFIETTINKILPYAIQIDKTPYIKLEEGTYKFSLKEYMISKVNDMINTHNLNLNI
jgi:(p)ppGpp synthase/HD superfamily hydrolase